MGETVTVLFCWAAEQLRFLAHIAAPFLLLETTAVGIARERSRFSLAALLDGLLFAGAELTHYLFPEVRGIAEA